MKEFTSTQCPRNAFVLLESFFLLRSSPQKIMSDGLSVLDGFQNCHDAKKYSSEKMLETNELVTKVYF